MRNLIQTMALHFYHMLECENISSLTEIHQQIWTREPQALSVAVSMSCQC